MSRHKSRIKPLYHISHISNKPSLELSGVLPEYAQGRKKFAYMVPENKLRWAIYHCAKRHNWPVGVIGIFAVRNMESCFRFGSQFWASNLPVRVEYFYSASEYLSIVE